MNNYDEFQVKHVLCIGAMSLLFANLSAPSKCFLCFPKTVPYTNLYASTWDANQSPMSNVYIIQGSSLVHAVAETGRGMKGRLPPLGFFFLFFVIILVKQKDNLNFWKFDPHPLGDVWIRCCVRGMSMWPYFIFGQVYLTTVPGKLKKNIVWTCRFPRVKTGCGDGCN